MSWTYWKKIFQQTLKRTNIIGFIDWNLLDVKGKKVDNFESLFTEINLIYK